MNLTKKKVWEACLQSLEAKAQNARSAMEEQQTMANEYGPPKDRYDSFRTQLLRKRDLFAEQYQQALNEIDLLKKIDYKKSSSKVEFGAVVQTNGPVLFIAVGLGKIIVNEQEVFVLSPKVPLFNAIRDLSTGESYTFNGKRYTVLNIL